MNDGLDESYSKTESAAFYINLLGAVTMLLICLMLVIKKGNIITASITTAYLFGFLIKAISMTDWL